MLLEPKKCPQYRDESVVNIETYPNPSDYEVLENGWTIVFFIYYILCSRDNYLRCMKNAFPTKVDPYVLSKTASLADTSKLDYMQLFYRGEHLNWWYEMLPWCIHRDRFQWVVRLLRRIMFPCRSSNQNECQNYLSCILQVLPWSSCVCAVYIWRLCKLSSYAHRSIFCAQRQIFVCCICLDASNTVEYSSDTCWKTLLKYKLWWWPKTSWASCWHLTANEIWYLHEGQ